MVSGSFRLRSTLVRFLWFCGAVKLADGSILAIMTEDRADESAMELIAFRISGF